MKKLKPQISILFLILVFVFSCSKDSENQPPTCEITSPNFGDELFQGEIVSISVNASDPDGSIKEIRFFIDGVGISSSKNFPYKYDWDTNDVEIGSHTIKVLAIDNSNLETEATVEVNIISSKFIVYNGTKYELTNANYQNYVSSSNSDENYGMVSFWSGVTVNDGFEVNGTGNVIGFIGDKTSLNNIFSSNSNEVQIKMDEVIIYLNTTFTNTENSGGIEDYTTNLNVNIKVTNGKYEISAQGTTSDYAKNFQFQYNGYVNKLEDYNY